MSRTSPILVAVDDPTVHSEAVHLVAVAGHPVVDASADPAAFQRSYESCFAVLLDSSVVPPPHRRPGVFLVGGEPDELDKQFAARPWSDDAFVLPAQAADLLRAIGALRHGGLEHRARGTVVAVVGAAGGAGASVLGASISRSCGAELAPSLVDAHRYSGGLDLLLGVENAVGARWGEITVGEGEVARDDIRGALPATADGIAVLTSSRTTISDPFVFDAPAVERTVAALGTAGLTVVDCPVQLVPQRCDLAVVVTPGEVRAAAAATRIGAELSARGVQCVAVARRRAWSGLSGAELERVTKLRVVGDVPDVPGLTKKLETAGLPRRLPRALERCARAVLAEVGL